MSNKYDDRISELTGWALMSIGRGETLRNIVSMIFQSGMNWMKYKEYEDKSVKKSTAKESG